MDAFRSPQLKCGSLEVLWSWVGVRLHSLVGFCHVPHSQGPLLDLSFHPLWQRKVVMYHAMLSARLKDCSKDGKHRGPYYLLCDRKLVLSHPLKKQNVVAAGVRVTLPVQ